MTKEEIFKQDILDRIRAFDEESKIRNDEIVKDLQSRAMIPSAIYHYTNDIGLKGILETGTFRLTDIFELNDPSELTYGISLLIDAFVDGIKTNAIDSNGQTFVAHVNDFISKGLKQSAYYFVLSFSSERDELGQWRAYADNGRGFALGFDRNILKEAFENDKTPGQENAEFPVTYDNTYLSNIQKELVEKIYLKIKWSDLKFLTRDEYFDKLIFSIVTNGLYRTLHFKHKAYENEQEYRFLQKFPPDQTTQGVNKRSRNYSLVRYREFNWRSLAAEALRDIKIGPAADKEKASKFVRDCLQVSKINSIEPTFSVIPYRAL